MYKSKLAVIPGAIAICTLAACAQSPKQNLATVTPKFEAELSRCSAQFPGSKNAIERARCSNEAYGIVRHHVPYPDLTERFNAQRLAIAEREQSGMITEEAAAAELAQADAAAIAEERRRIEYEQRAHERANRAASRAAKSSRGPFVTSVRY